MNRLVPGTGIEPVRLAARDFKSLVSTNFTIRAKDGGLYARPKCKEGKRIATLSLFCLERQKSLELSTSTLARLRSTN